MTGYSKLISYGVVGALVAVVVFSFMVKRSLNNIYELSEKEVAARAEVQRLEQQILAYKTAQSDLSKAAEKELLYSFIVGDKQLSLPIEEMEDAIDATNSAHQLKILRDSLRTDSKSEMPASKILGQDGLEEIPYILTVQNTSYIELVNLFQYLEHLPHYTEVSKVNLSLQEGVGGREELAATINGVFLVKPDEIKN